VGEQFYISLLRVCEFPHLSLLESSAVVVELIDFLIYSSWNNGFAFSRFLELLLAYLIYLRVGVSYFLRISSNLCEDAEPFIIEFEL
jgi:predicted neutral ceramidase superfamily lipid hydrolase